MKHIQPKVNRKENYNTGGVNVKQENNKKNKNIIIKILISIIIIVVIISIYFYKRVENDKQNNVQNNIETREEGSLPLAISSVDLDEIKSYGLPFVIDFGSDSCIPCKEMAPVLETLHEEWQGKAIVHFVDVWKYSTAANDFPVSVIPTQLFYNADGTPFVPSDELAQEIEFALYGSEETNGHVFTVHQGGLTEEQMKKIFSEMGVE